MKRQIVFIAMCSMLGGGSFAGWAEEMKISGDFRYRHETINEEDKDTRNRQRIRARLMLEAKANEEVDVVIRLAGGSDDPVSSNETLTGAFSSKHLWLDMAYFNWHPEVLAGINLVGGKMKMPFIAVSDLIWDGDLNPEGLAINCKLPIGDAVKLLANGAGWWVEERSKDSDTMMYGGQLGADIKISGVGFLFGGSFFGFTNMKGYNTLYDSTKGFGNSVTKAEDGTTSYQNEYRELEAFAKISAKLFLPVSLFGNFVVNTDADENKNGFLAGVKIGSAKEPGSFQVAYDYRKLEKDAVIGAFSDSDSWGGGTDGKGHRLSAAYQISKNWQFGVTGFLDDKNLDESKDYKRLQLDLIAKF